METLGSDYTAAMSLCSIVTTEGLEAKKALFSMTAEASQVERSICKWLAGCFGGLCWEPLK